jgi:uncharacterized protein with FMN-binding domain
MTRRLPRSLAALASTGVGLWLVLAYKSTPAPRTVATTGGTSLPSASTSTVPPPSSPTTTATTPTTVAQSSAGTRTIDGTTISTNYGDVQVEVVLQGNRIVDVKALQLPFDRPRSEFISEQVAPMLRSEVLDAQSAQIDTISGATFTSEGYAESLQSALDKANA